MIEEIMAGITAGVVMSVITTIVTSSLSNVAWEKEAIANGVAEYRIDSSSGSPEFHWIQPKVDDHE